MAARDNRREFQGGHTADEALAQSLDLPSRSVVTLGAAYVPNYADPSRAHVVVYEALAADPNTVAPSPEPPVANYVVLPLDKYGVVVFTVDFVGTASITELQVWVEGGLDRAGDDVGWLLAATFTDVVDHIEFTVHTGQRRVFLRPVTGALDAVNEAIVRICGVA